MNTENRERAIRIIKGLLEKKTERGAFLAEEVAATAKVQELLERYQLTLFDVKTQTIQEDMNKVSVDTGRKNSNPGELQLANAIAVGFDCKLVIEKMYNTHFTFLGYASDTEVAEYTYSYLVRRLTDMGEVAGRSAGAYKQKLFRYRNNFLIGAASEIRRRMLEEKKQRTTATVDTVAYNESTNEMTASIKVETKPVGTSLTFVKKPKVDEFVKKTFPRLVNKPASKVKYNVNAIEAGRKAGATIELRKGVYGEQNKQIS